jgi:phosphate transport system permease protein
MSILAESPPIVPPRTRSRLSTSTVEQAIKAFFRGNALVAVVVLALITIFLFREGFGFFGQNLSNLRLYRAAGLEYVDIIRAEAEKHSELSRGLNGLRLRQFRALQSAGMPVEQSNEQLASFDEFATAFSDSAEPLNGLVSDLGEVATALKAELFAQSELAAQKAAAERRGRTDEAAMIQVPDVNREVPLTVLRAGTTQYDAAASSVATVVNQLLATAPALPDAEVQQAFDTWKQRAREYVAGLPAAGEKLRAWSPDAPVPWYRSISAFLFGEDWITASFWQDWYGIRPLLVGSIMVSAVALFFAVPLGVASAVYVSEIASRQEKRIIKPYIEFIAAIPSVVLGFFGIAVVGQVVRAMSELPMFSWVPFFPISERLNVFTAGLLLALMAVPTIFTLSEDALRNVPRGFKEASYALGANRLQTIARVLVPASLSGIVSAVLLGLGRVIGETMVVLLCAGNRIDIPDFTQGLGAFFQPVHTMTGIIAQEMGEVVRGSIHYRALFMVGLVLFTITLLINYFAQKLVARYRMGIG